MIHRTDPQAPDAAALPTDLLPMLAVAGALPDQDDGWAYEFKWDGARALVAVDGGRPTATSRSGKPLTGSFPELRTMAEALGPARLLLDGELVVLGSDHAPSFSRMQHRLKAAPGRAVDRAVEDHPAHFIAFDLLHLDGQPLLGSSYDDRRAALEDLGLQGPSWGVTPSFHDHHGADVLDAALGMGMEGVVAKRRASPYLPGRRSASWVKVKPERTQEVVLAGWTTGNGNRSQGIGALVLGIPEGDGLRFVGKVGSGFTEDAMRDLRENLARRSRRTTPFGTRPPGLGEVHWVEPELVGEVRFAGWTPDGHLRQPSWRGLRPDKRPGEVVRES
jgi:bifunctional non-homologous end joining protein LigD